MKAAGDLVFSQHADPLAIGQLLAISKLEALANAIPDPNALGRATEPAKSLEDRAIIGSGIRAALWRSGEVFVMGVVRPQISSGQVRSISMASNTMVSSSTL